MQKTTISILIGLIAIGLIAWVLHITTGKAPVTEDMTAREVAQQEAQQPTKTINVKHQYKDGVHTFMGTVETPTPCFTVAAVVLPGDLPEIHITTTPTEAEMCAEVVTEHTFTVKHEGAAETQFLATVDDEPVNLNQFDIDPDVDIESVEILIKG